MTYNLIQYLKKYPDLNLDDVAYTLQIGKNRFEYRQMIVCGDPLEAINLLEKKKDQTPYSIEENQSRPVVFLFTGAGEQYVGMTLELYQIEPTFRDVLDQCFSLFRQYMDIDLKELVFKEKKEQTGKIDLRKMLRSQEEILDQTHIAHPLIFSIEYALSKLWIHWGIQPESMMGYSIGEYVAACLAGVFSLEDVVYIVARRSQLIQKLPKGGMLAVGLSTENISPFLSAELSISGVNAPDSCVVSGSLKAIEGLEETLSKKEIVCRRLKTIHPFHSKLMQPIVDAFNEVLEKISFNPPVLPYISNLTGRWITKDQAIDPLYWLEHLCQPVEFSKGIEELWKDQNRILLEVGPGHTLSTMVLQHPLSKSLSNASIKVL